MNLADLRPGPVSELAGIDLQSGRPVRVILSGSKIERVEPLPDHRAESGDLPFLAPGLVDLQINGYAGIDFNASDLTPEKVHEAAKRILGQGVTTFYPTVITNSPEWIEKLCAVIAEACDRYPLANDMIPGIHLEGPFISKEDGPRGAHPLQYVRAPDWDLFRVWQEAAGGRIRLITLSPEWEGSTAFIEKCVAEGILVAIGHTAATSRQIADAVRAGARLSTHLGNGAHLMLPRHPNYIWDQLAESELAASVIGDGFHLPDAVLKVFMAVKKGKIVLVSDAVQLAGLPPGTYRMHIGGDVVLTESGKLHMAENPLYLAGSAVMLKDSIAGLVRRGLAELSQAWMLGSVEPAKLMGLRPLENGISPGAQADLVLFSWTGNAVQIYSVIKGGIIRT